MPLIKGNVIANMLGNGWAAMVSIAFLPLYIHFIGIESYALVGFYVAMQAILSRLDMGLTAVMSRELARLSATENGEQAMRDLVRTLELVCCLLAAVIVIIMASIAPWVSQHWFNGSTLSAAVIHQSVVLMGIVIALRLLYGFYCSGFLGLQRQVLLNKAKVLLETIVALGSVLVLWRISPTIEAFFMWQAIAGGFAALTMALLLWKALPASEKPVLRLDILRTVARFAGGVSLATLTASVFIQVDKLMLSAMLPIEVFGFYALASAVSMGSMFLVSASIFSAMYPAFTQLIASQNEVSLTQLYHKGSQAMTVLLVPAALVISFFSKDILEVWTQNSALATQVAPILSVIVVAAAFSGIRYLAYALQLSHGWTRLTVFSNLIAIVFLFAALQIVVPLSGVQGAALAFLIVNALYTFFYVYIMHRKVLKMEFYKWLSADFILPSVAAFSIVLCFWLLKPMDMNDLSKLMWILLAEGLSTLAAVMFAPVVRREMTSLYNAIFANR